MVVVVIPSVDGWRRCHSLDGEVITNMYSSRSHPQSPPLEEVTAQSPPALINPIIIPHARAQRRYLAILTQGVLMETACADSGSQVNCITEAYAEAISARVTKKSPPSYANFPPHRSWSAQSNFTSSKISSDILFGKEFLRATQTLDIHHHRLRTIGPVPFSIPAVVRSVGRVGERVQSWIEGKPFWSLPDTGADVNLISSNMARALGYHHNGFEGKTIQVWQRIEIEFADCSTVRTEGTITLTVSFCPPEKGNSALHKMFEPSGKKSTNRSVEVIRGNTRILEPFHVLEGLNHDLILGESLLATVDAYNQHAGRFVPSEIGKVVGIAIARKKKSKEGSGGGGSRHTLTPEQKFRDNFSLEQDRYLKEKNDIESRLRLGLISNDQAGFRTLRRTRVT